MNQIDFIIEFFFLDNKKVNEEDQRNLLMNSTKFRVVNSALKKDEISTDKIKMEKKVNINQPDEDPTYFKQFKINETELFVNFEYGEGSALVK
jgi:hypothetical protein